MYSIYFLISWANVQLMFIMQTYLGLSVHLISGFLLVAFLLALYQYKQNTSW